ncbi:hypothetical protein R1flu_019546 [Riccia fluitans]|uniref:Uncharacterized protein n=1 Tax=Riccia fluitans TaxID=41844 RepID=A0ABD1ZIZ3_9MARC
MAETDPTGVTPGEAQPVRRPTWAARTIPEADLQVLPSPEWEVEELSSDSPEKPPRKPRVEQTPPRDKERQEDPATGRRRDNQRRALDCLPMPGLEDRKPEQGITSHHRRAERRGIGREAGAAENARAGSQFPGTPQKVPASEPSR